VAGSGRFRDHDPQVNPAVARVACCDVVKPRRGRLEGQDLRRHARRPAGGAGRPDRRGEMGGPNHRQVQTLHDHRRPAGGEGQGADRQRRREYGVRGYITAYDAATGKQGLAFSTPRQNPTGAPMARPQTPRYDSGRPAPGAKACGAKAAAAERSGTLLSTTPGSTCSSSAPGMAARGATYCVRVDAGTTCSCPPSWRSAPTTGAYVWHYQLVPGDSWDYTATQPLILADLRVGERRHRVVMQAPKNGFFLRVGGGHWKSCCQRRNSRRAPGPAE